MYLIASFSTLMAIIAWGKMMICTILYKDGTMYIFSSHTYEEEELDFTESRAFIRKKPHAFHPDCIHISSKGVVTYFFTNGTVGKEQIEAFDDGVKVVRFD